MRKCNLFALNWKRAVITWLMNHVIWLMFHGITTSREGFSLWLAQTLAPFCHSVRSQAKTKRSSLARTRCPTLCVSYMFPRLHDALFVTAISHSEKTDVSNCILNYSSPWLAEIQCDLGRSACVTGFQKFRKTVKTDLGGITWISLEMCHHPEEKKFRLNLRKT